MRAVLINQKNSKEPEFMAPPLQIYVGTTWIKFRCSRSGLMGNRINVAPFIQRNLQNREWVPYLKRYSVISNFVMYDTDNQMAIFPRYSLDKLLKYLGSTRVELVEVAPITPRTVKMEMKNNFELRKEQEPIVKVLVDETKYFKPVSASCGEGKTLCSIYSIVTSNQTGLIVLGELIEQWYKSFRQFTKLSSKELVVIQG